ncbi:MAG: NFACT family protein [Chloroflexi bacterium]|nr:NFACT family protein [Chloroflexota bacterium]
MPLDTLTLSAIADELRDQLLGGRVQRIVRPSALALGLEIYTGERHQLLLSAEPADAVVLVTTEKLRRGEETASPLQLLLRKYVRGARLRAIEQPELERVLRFRFEGEHGEVELVCEIMGRLSNLILVAPDRTILGAAKPVPPAINRYRTILPTHPYVPPPRQEKEHPLLLTPALLAEMLRADGGGLPLWRRLVQGVAGISPLLARELVYRATGEVEPEGRLSDEAVRNLVNETVGMFRLAETHNWRPSIARRRGDPADAPLREYAPYLLTHLPGREEVASIQEAIRLVRAAAGGIDPYARVRQRLKKALEEQIGRLEARLNAQREALAPEEELERLALQGNAILAMAWEIQPGQTELVVNPQDFLADGALSATELRIPLDPARSPAENAQSYFEEYRKRKSANERLPQLIAETEMQLAYLRQLSTDMDLAEDRAQLDAVRDELAEAGVLAGHKRAKGAPQGEPLMARGPDGTPILVGRNSRQNDLVTFRRAAPDDLWLHAHGVPGAHVIIKSAGRPVDERTLRQAARLAAYYSAARHEAHVQVDYTERRYVRHIKGAPAGMVTYTRERTLIVEPETGEP